jgi:hypothetical protein
MALAIVFELILSAKRKWRKLDGCSRLAEVIKGRNGDQINAVMSAVGYNFCLILKWLRALLCKIIAALWAAIIPFSAFRAAS